MNPKVGEILKAEREKKGLSLHEIGLNLKINARVLKAIEENDAAHLPANTFLRGFVRSYAQYLKLDGKAIIQLLDDKGDAPAPKTASDNSSSEVSKESAEESKYEAKPKAEPNKPSRTKNRPIENEARGSRLILGMGILALIGAIVFVLKLIDKYQNESRRTQVQIKSSIEPKATPLVEKSVPEKTDVIPPVSGEALATPLEPGGQHASPSPSPTPSPSPSPTATPVKAFVVATPAPTKAPPNPTPKPTPVAPSPSLSPTPAPAAASAEVEATPTATPKTANKPVEVIVEALNNVEIKYSFGDGSFQTMSMVGEEIHTFKSKHGVQLEVSDGGSISVIVNGLERGVPGTVGLPIKLSYPK